MTSFPDQAQGSADDIKEPSADAIKDVETTPDNASESSNSKTTFLESFSQAENKRIMRKVDRRFLVITGMMYLIKQVTTLFSYVAAILLTRLADRRE